ncbi:hypothetical protein GBAR_LOCUS20328, partial [Geodia barretti]
MMAQSSTTVFPSGVVYSVIVYSVISAFFFARIIDCDCSLRHSHIDIRNTTVQGNDGQKILV